MTSVTDKIPEMLSLAAARTEDARVRLAEMLAEVFLNPSLQLTLREEEKVNELIDELLLNGSSDIRRELLARFTDVAAMPRRIAVGFAQTDIETARPVLAATKTLTDNDLVQIVEARSGEHALAIAARDRISEAVADALVMTGDVRVMQAVAENLGAQLSSEALQVTVDAARYAEPLREPILHRPEISAELAMKLYWWVEQGLRRYVLKRFGITSGQIDQALATTITAFLKDHAHQRTDDSVMLQVADWMQDHEAMSVQILPQVLRMGHFRLFNIMLARLSKLSLALIDTIVQETGGRGLAAICRAIGVDKPGFVSLFLLSRGGRLGEQIVHPRELSHALATFDRMNEATAKDLLHSWSVNPDYFVKMREGATVESRS
jgi:uncharacterized protein (DUF2336 family)